MLGIFIIKNEVGVISSLYLWSSSILTSKSWKFLL